MNTPWLEHYDAGIPRSFGAYPQTTLVDVIREHRRRRPDATNLIFKKRRLTNEEVDRASDALAHALSRRGVKPGDRVAFVLPNCPQFIIAQLAVWKIGAIAAPQSPMYTDRELEESLRTSGSETVITLTPFYTRVKRIQNAAGVKRVIATNIKEYFPPLLNVAFTLLKEKKDGHRITLESGDVWFQDLVEFGDIFGEFRSHATPSDPALILMSGGTTGTPKGVVCDHQALIATGTQISTWMHEPLTVPDASLVLPLPLFHVYGAGGVYPAVTLLNVPLSLIPNPRDIADVVNTIAHVKPSVFCAVPTLFTALLARPEIASRKADIRSIRACFSGAAPLLAETKKRFEELTGGRIIEGYSLTEAVLAACINPYRGVNKIGSVGMPLPDVLVRIVDEDGVRDLALREVGEIAINAPQLMRGYWNNPEETANVLRLADDGRLWLFTGDLGYLDEDGYLFIVDRKKDLIKTSGFQVWPREVEEVIASHPAVADVGVAGVPDEKKGEVVTAWIVPRPDVEYPGEAAMRAFCHEKLAPYKVPKHFVLRTDLPKTMVGKVLRRALVAEAVAAATTV